MKNKNKKMVYIGISLFLIVVALANFLLYYKKLYSFPYGLAPATIWLFLGLFILIDKVLMK